MSVDPASTASGLPAGAAASEPAWVRRGSASLQRDYAVGVEFEQMLAQQLAGAMTASAGLGEESGEGEGASGAAAGPLGSMLPQALATGVTQGGGLGLAAEIARDMQGTAGAHAGTRLDAATGGTTA